MPRRGSAHRRPPDSRCGYTMDAVKKGMQGAMDSAEIREALDEVFDQAVLFHGFTDYYRDYEVVVQVNTDPASDIAPQHLSYLFRYCVEVGVETALSPEIWQRSLDDRLIDVDAWKETPIEGHVWGVRWHNLYPGGRVVEDSPRAAAWTEALRRPFYEVELETNVHALNLVCSDLQVRPVAEGYSPFTVPPLSDG